MFQSHQEKIYQEFMATKANERANQLEQYYEQIVSRTSTELSSILTVLFHFIPVWKTDHLQWNLLPYDSYVYLEAEITCHIMLNFQNYTRVYVCVVCSYYMQVTYKILWKSNPLWACSIMHIVYVY